MSIDTDKNISLPDKIQVALLRGCFVLLVAMALFFFCLRIGQINNECLYGGWTVSEWLINYEGGFVRRGLCGEILYGLYQVHPYPVRDMILILGFTGFFFFMVLLIGLFRREGWSPVLLIAPCLIQIPTFLGGISLFGLRKDHWLLLLAYGIFYFYTRYIRRRDIWSLVAMQFLSVVVLLIHEAAFFFIFPLLIVHYLLITYKKRGLAGKSVGAMFLLFLPAALTMGAVCLFKGNQAVAEAIWTSWKPCMEAYPLPCDDVTKIGPGVSALTWDTWQAFKNHMTITWMSWFLKLGPAPDIGISWMSWFLKPIPSWPFALINIAGIYYLVSRLNTVNLRWNRLKKVDSSRMGLFLLLQGIFMIPLFTVLSCDLGRIIPYWVFSSLFAYHFLKEDASVFPAGLNRASEWLQDKISKIKCLSVPWVYFLILVFLPVSLVGVRWKECFLSLVWSLVRNHIQ